LANEISSAGFSFYWRANSRNLRIEVLMSRRRKILIVAGIVLGVAVLIPVIRHYQLRFAVANYVAELKAKGEPLDLAQVIPPPVPPEQNGAPVFLKAASLLDTNWNVLGSNPPPAMLMVLTGKAMVESAQPDIHTRDGKNSWEEIESALTEDSEALKLLSQIVDHPTLDFNLDYKDGVDKIKILQLAPLKRSAQKLSAAAMVDLHRGDSASAVKSVSTMLALVNGASNDRVVISELVRIAIAQIAAPVAWEILQSTNVTDEQLATLQNDWMNLEFIRGDENALAMERVISRITVTKWRDSSFELQNYFDRLENFEDTEQKDTAADKFKIRIKVLMWRYWWSYPDELRLLKADQAVLETVRSMETNYSFLTAQRQQEDKFQKLFTSTNDEETIWFSNPKEMDMHYMLSASARGLAAVFDKVMRVEAAKQIILTAVALKRYQIKHGNYPADLNSLVPEFVQAVPLDPVDGEPLRYRLNADGTFLLYSVGENGVDDGGDASLEKGVTSSSFYWQNNHALDWVWPQPATEEEIQAYYKKLSAQKN
jgi:hypothetical protein